MSWCNYLEIVFIGECLDPPGTKYILLNCILVLLQECRNNSRGSTVRMARGQFESISDQLTELSLASAALSWLFMFGDHVHVFSAFQMLTFVFVWCIIALFLQIKYITKVTLCSWLAHMRLCWNCENDLWDYSASIS